MYCPKCGAESDGLQFCPVCGTPMQTHSDASDNKSDSSELVNFRVHRMAQNNTNAVPISVFVDGYLYGTVDNGATSEFQIVDGFHTITLRLAGKTISKPFNVSKVSDCYIGVSGKPGSPVFFDDIPENYEEECRKKEADEKVTVVHDGRRRCNKWVSFILCLFFGVTGTHNFYEGKVILGIIRLLGVSSAGALFLFSGQNSKTFYWIALAVFIVAWIVDIFVILFKKNPYYVDEGKHTVPLSLLVILLCVAIVFFTVYSWADRTFTAWNNMIENTFGVEPANNTSKSYEFGYENKSPRIMGVAHKIILPNNEVVNIIEKGEITQNPDGIFIPVLIENQTSKNLMVQIRDSSINGYMVEAIFSPKIASGKKINDVIEFDKFFLERAGIKEIGDIELRFHIFDADSWNDYYDTDIIKMEFN